MSQRVVYFNGQFVTESEARISIFDSALMYGDMAFEMTRTFLRKPFRLDQHLKRLFASLRLLEIDCEMSVESMELATIDTLERNLPTESPDIDWQIMHNVSRGPLGIYETVFPEGCHPTITINCWPLITHLAGFAELYEMGVDLVIPAQATLPAHLVDPKAKTRSRLHYQMALLQARRMGPRAWPILVDPNGFLSEGPGWNLFLVKNGVLLTPEPRNVLLGVSRETTMELASEAGIPVKEANLGRYDALQADEIFCTATSFSLVHAATFEGQLIGEGVPGPIFRKLRDAWNRRTGVDIVAQAHSYATRLAGWKSGQRDKAMSYAEMATVKM